MTILNKQPSFKSRLQRQIERNKHDDMGTDPEQQINGEEQGHIKDPDDDEMMSGSGSGHQPAGEQELTGLTADPGELPPPSPTPLSVENYEAINGFYPPHRDDGGIAPKRYSAYYRDEPDLDKHVENFYDEDYTPKDRDHLLDPLEMDAVRKKKRNRFSRKDGGVFWTVPWIAFCVFVAVLLGISVHYGTKGSGPSTPPEEGLFDYGPSPTKSPQGGDTEVTTTVDGDTEVIATVGNDGNVTNVTIVTHPSQPVTFMPTIAPSLPSSNPSAAVSAPPGSSPNGTSSPTSFSTVIVTEIISGITEAPTVASSATDPTAAPSAITDGIPTAVPASAGPTTTAQNTGTPVPGPTHDPFAPPIKLTPEPTGHPTDDGKHHDGKFYHRDWWAADKLECGKSSDTLQYENAYFHYLYSNDKKTQNGFDMQCCDPCYWMYQDQCMCPAAFLEVPRQDDAENQWQLTHQRNLAELTRTMEHGEPLDLIMYGDSITEHLQGTDWTRPTPNLQPCRTTFESMFQDDETPFKGLALGIGGDVSTWLLWRLQHGEFPTGKLAPRAVWLNIGTNEFPMLCNPERIFMGIVSVVQLIHDLSPSTAIIVNSILPRCTGGDTVGTLFQDDNPNGVPGWTTQTNWINKQLDCWASGVDGVYFLNNNYALLTEDEERIELTRMLNGEDCLHPNEDGYKIILQTIQDLLHDILTED